MAQVINTNTLSLMTQNNMNKSQSALSTAIERLSSGLRINSAKDDAAGQAIANRFTSNINGLTQASRNANDGISVAQTTEGSLSEINNNLQRIRELSVQAANGTNSASDLSSIQDEISSRLSEIDRVSGQTQFNGVNVLASDQTMKIQVGANDGQTISIDLQKIDSTTLGLNGFNVNGSGTIANKAATVSDINAAGTTTPSADGTYAVTTKFAALSSSQAFAKLNTGDTVATTTAAGTTTYTYDATKGNFTTTANVATADVGTFADTLKPVTGSTANGTYTSGTGSVDFVADANGNLTVGGKAAYITADGSLTTNNTGTGTPTQATLNALYTAADANTTNASSVKLGDTTYNFAGSAAGLSYTKTVSADSVLSDVSGANAAGTVTNAKITYNSGVQTYSANFGGGTTTAADAGKSADTYVDGDGDMTTTAAVTVNYAVDKDTGAVTVASNGTGATGKYAETVGSTAYVSSTGKLTTNTTSTGTATADPLAALDAAIAKVDKFRSSLGAVQNRFDSAITNLANTTTNLSSAQSRIQDADYATEVSAMSKAQILQQAGTSVLAKANQVPQSVLSLLQ
ncbi:FliC/FljB family flagellin [Rahnella variigena]|uniref:Flagellin n=1 Tax=Rahnella variigena TaxID=574964 RepID=A0ABX9PXI0_9GAMM|nr:FliC/FljB family flagellin [Rahnella variigena]RJT51801.1 FliC/FljB family flagellin [Rahnella variigena]RKF69729.1 flagellin FliC [Rahnella variigena]